MRSSELLAALFLGVALLACTSTTEGSPTQEKLLITTKSGTALEERGREQLLRLVEDHDVDRWIFTHEVVIESGVIPHSHPVLTLNTRFVDDDRKQLAMFLHEQFHWYTFERGDQMGAAMAEVRERFPTVPVGKPEGAHSEFSTYIHLVVCYLELQAVTELQGESFARASLAANENYTWIYEQVLSDDGFIKGVLQRHGLSLP